MTVEHDVDFSLIREDYDFFLSHSTETAAQVLALVPHMTPPPTAMLDFGCGTGKFTEVLLAAAPAPSMRLALVEPAAPHLKEAASRLRPLVDEVVESPDLARAKFNLILANHSLYYVESVSKALAQLVVCLAPKGRLIVALLDRSNKLARLWQAGFGLIGKPFPFVLAEDVEQVLTGLGVNFHCERIGYRIDFQDSAGNRRKVLRFLFAGDDAIQTSDGLALFDPHRRKGRIVVETSYPHIVVG